MANHYICPKCKGYLNVAEHIVFSIRTDEKKSGLILLNPQIGDYKVITNENFKVAMGTHHEFCCPICGASLQTEKNSNLAKVIVREENGNQYELLFSEVAGEHSTYAIRNGKIEAYGEDQGHYSNFFGESFSY